MRELMRILVHEDILPRRIALRSPHRMHSVSVRRGPHKKRLPNNQCSIAATGR